MKFYFGAVLAFAASVFAKPILLNSDYEVQEDVPFTLRWSDAQGAVTITLMTGTDPEHLKKVTDIVSGVTDSSYTFTPADLPSGTYAFRITDESGESNYSPQFEYSGTGTLPSSTSLSSSASASSTSASVSSTSSSSSTSESSSTSTTSSSSSSSSTESSSTSSESTSTSSTFTTTTTVAPTTTRAQTSATTAPANTNNGQRFASPLALVLVTVAALVFFN
ncbi:hypothetical protein C8A03DRAFT_13933 [Achaetomium macrosporum]|uniref:Extracellular matrix protein n=1 Tax=Achaetomium macrosporum TaxID=79813 RepID=A0AAN7HCF8_9PEZI|nr:hypothetical protein C8A03DRAFT_13933 [Achaetomium macrosporum]